MTSLLAGIQPADLKILYSCLALPSADYEGMSIIFKHHRRLLKEIPAFYDRMHSANIGIGGQKSNYDYHRPRFQLFAEAYNELLQAVSAEEFEVSCEIVKNVYNYDINFCNYIRNIISLRNGGKANYTLNFKGPYASYDFWETTASYLLWLTFFYEKYANCVQLIPDDRLISVLGSWKWTFAAHAPAFTNVRAFQARLKAMKDPLAHLMHDWLEYQCVFLMEGRPRERAAAMLDAGGGAQLIMNAAADLDEGNNAQALPKFRAALKDFECSRIFEYPLENLLYGIALWRCADAPAVLKTCQSLLKLKKIRQEAGAAPLHLILRALLNQEPADAAGEAASAFKGVRRLAGFTQLVNKAFAMKGKLPDFWMSGYDHCCSELPWFEYEAACQADPDAPRARELREALGMNPLLPHLEEKPEWQKQLELLIKMQSADAQKISGTAGTDKGAECVTYLLSLPDLEVTPRLRKIKADGSFTKGRNIAISKFMQGDCPGLTAQDRAVGKLVKQSYFGLALTGSAVVHALIGHPYVFDSDDPDRHLQIVKAPLKITVQTDPKGGYLLDTNVPSAQIRWEREYFISKQGGDVIEVIEATPVQKQLLKTFSMSDESAHFPSQAREMLTTLLEKLSVNTTVMSNLLKNSANLERRKGDPRTIFRIEPADAGSFSITALIHPLPGAPLTCSPGKGLSTLAANVDGKPLQVERDLKKETENFKKIEESLTPIEEFRSEDFEWLTDTEGCLRVLAAVRENEKTAAAEWPEGEAFKLKRASIGFDAISLSARRMGDWLEVEGNVKLDSKTTVTIGELLTRLRSAAGNFVQLGDKEFIELSDELRKRLSTLNDATTRKPGRGKTDGVSVSVFKADVFSEIEDDDFHIDADQACRDLLARLAEAQHYEPEIPKGLKAELRDYQREGFAWMSRLASWGAGSILADDMGLGKTVQTIALLLERSKLGPQLVVMPTAVLCNWEQELERFAPGLSVKVFNREDRAELVKNLGAGDVVLTSYGVLAQEIELLGPVEWKTAVLDEAHTVKNRTTKTSKAVMTLQAEGRVLLTGTPLQNHLSEIWNLFQFANPGLLASYDDFVARFITPIEMHKDRNVQRRLKRLISPFILRRTKAEVLDELPEKTELTIRVTLSEEELALYESLRQAASTKLETGEINPIQALAELTKLRLAACHPELINPELKLASAKTHAFMELVNDLRESGHRALVFSQFTSHLALIRRELELKGIEYLYLDGSHTPAQRQKLVDAFQKGDMPLFLISLKAGGTGLNLTAADYVIHLDPWWNPAIEDQASDRAYRIGQDRPVTIYRLIAANTIEEKILRLHETKKSLADALLEGSDLSSRLSREEILRLLSESGED